MNRLRLSTLAATLCLSLPAHAQAERTIDRTRIHLSDVSEGFDGELAALDLGAAPTPGNSRTVPRSEVEAQLRAAGEDTKKLHMPASIVIRSAARRFSGAELTSLFQPQLAAALPRGISLRQLKLTRTLVASPSVTVGEAHFPKIPKHEGELTVTATVELRQGDEVVARVPVTAIIDVSREATRPALERGARVNVVIEHGGAKVSALALSMSDAELGEIILFRVASTQRVLHARVESADSARVVEQ